MNAMYPENGYRCLYLSGLNGYVVYRHFFDIQNKGVSNELHAKTHKIAVFVCESEAEDYCAYRNEMAEKYGTDDVSVIHHAGHR